MTPRATYRVQLSAGFDLAGAAGLAGYLAAVGVSHLYASPLLQAAPGSRHGYDIVDPTRISAELGGSKGLDRLGEALKPRSMGIVVDIVPNHMATATPGNPWWWDLLLRGRSSPYAGYFDVDWKPSSSTIRDKVVLGVLNDRSTSIRDAVHDVQMTLGLTVALVILVILLGAVTLGTGGYIAYAGGKIRHREFRNQPAPPKRAGGEH